MGHVSSRLLWTGMSIYDDFSEHGLEAHSRWVGSSWLADYGLYIYTVLHSDVVQIGVPEEFHSSCLFISLGLSILS